MTVHTIIPNVWTIKDWSQRWSAYREGPFAREAADSISHEAGEQMRAIKMTRFPDEQPCIPLAAWEKAKIANLIDLRRACYDVASADDQQSAEDMRDAIDSMDEWFWPDNRTGEPCEDQFWRDSFHAINGGFGE